MYRRLRLQRELFPAPGGAIATIHPRDLYVPMRHAGYSECVPCVQPGEEVRAGQLIGTEAPDGLPVYSPVSGHVLSMGRMRLADGTACTCLHIENDKTMRTIAHAGADRLDLLSRDRLRSMLRQSGLGGPDGPEYRKYPPASKIRHILIDAVDAEPGLFGRLLLGTEADRVIRGARALARITDGLAVICVGKDDPAAAGALREAAKLSPVRVKSVPVRYPAEARRLACDALGLRIPRGMPLCDAGVAVTGVWEAAAFAESIASGLPVTKRIVTVTGDSVRPALLCVPNGTCVGDVYDFCGGVGERIIVGGAMTGMLCGRGTPLTFACASVLVLSATRYAEAECIRCGRCADVCPEGLIPTELERALLCGLVPQKTALCTGCGCCSYVCPSRRNPAGRIFYERNAV